MKCGLCGRTLKGMDSISKGYGPVCLRKIKPSAPRRSVPSANYNFVDDINYTVPGQMGLSDFMEIPEASEEKSNDKNSM